MNKFILPVIAFFILALSLLNNTGNLLAKNVDEKEAEGLAAFIVNAGYANDDELPDNPDTNKCDCNGSKFIIHGDGHRTPCPCGDKCKCKKPGGSVETVEKKNPPTQSEIYDQYYVIKWTASWCGPCRTWDINNRSKLDSAGVQVVNLDYDSNRGLASKYGVTSLPSFDIAKKADEKLYHKFRSNVSSQTILNKIDELAKKDVLKNNQQASASYKYIERGRTNWSINGFSNPSKKILIYHIRSEPKHNSLVKDWPLELLTQAELKAIHDDLHNNSLNLLLKE